MIFRLELDSSNEYDNDAGEYTTMEEEIIELLTYLNKEGYVIYEYMVARKSPITPLLVLPLSSGFLCRRNLFFFEKEYCRLSLRSICR
ncbi:hypothetical protein MM326_04610 [Alkalihalobacillus sp. LMS6]|uniref:hypothetical protein n=1 Tax=Alkalihalobacillus sp. LMS6 TaxID=2924034 RepID=UPI0020D01E19|nr:hypothetical protein [Alkalihalobacillus sp. LMS6]UTR07318.1 hypothetical protein MM326_04610 [Alkalihalobacillus sp. LMS6]